ncbi:MAG: ABC-F family ATP-binding cassette domain-containing protein [Firmicutes bacterium]|nr:ABC-F family ATP-binding cassette domain-containing protein [Bacillota bacterium]
MSLLRVEGCSKSYSGRDVLRDVSLRLEENERAGLVGPNGAGKTTLLRLIAGEEEPDAGAIHLRRGARLGYLRQDPAFTPGRSLREEALAAFAELDGLERRLREMEAELRARPGDAALLAEYGEALQRFEARGGYEREARTDRVLAGLGFPPETWDVRVELLSGGQRVRLGLARLLLEQPDLLLLDEPTNHLDLDAIEWLERYLAEVHRGAVLMVSHDRVFLDRTVTRIFAVHDGTVEAYSGNYTAYVEQRRRRLEAAEEEWRRVEEERRRLEEYVRRYRAGNRATQAKSREKRLARLPSVERPKLDERRLRLAFEPAARGGREVLQVEGLGHRFDGRLLFRGFSARVERGERVGLVGPNGAGKTTMLRLLLGELAPSEGEVLWGAGVDIGYFSQDLRGLREDRSVLDEIMEAGDFTLEEARTLLARFLFRGEDVFRRVEHLSGGERNRLLLAKLVLSRANVLILDEPTNHLDIPAREALEEALDAFPGTMFFVTHDRYFLRLATRLWVFEGGAVRDFRGTYAEWEAARRAAAGAAGTPSEGGPGARGADAPAPRGAAAGGPAAADTGAAAAAGRGSEASAAPGSAPLSKNERRRLEAALRAAEERIEALEAERAALEGQLADPDLYRDEARAQAAVQRFRAVEEELERLYEEWERRAAALQSQDSAAPWQS